MKFLFLTLALCLVTWYLHGQDTPVKTDRSVSVGRHKNNWPERPFSFQVNIGMVVNKSFVNVKRPEKDLAKPVDSYEKMNNSTFLAPTVGVSLLLGRSSRFKKVIGVNYLMSVGEYNYTKITKTPVINNNSNIEYLDYNYKTTVHYINVVAAGRFIIAKVINLEPGFCVSIPVATVSYVKGIKRNVTSVRTGPQSYTQTVSTEEVDEVKHENQLFVPFSFCPKIAYNWPLKEHSFEIYAAGNIAFQYRLPWWMFGISWYPFKALR